MAKHEITLFKTQMSVKSAYLGAECATQAFVCNAKLPCKHGNNGIQDPILGEHYCSLLCSTQHICLAPDVNEVSIGLSSKWQDPLITFGWDLTPPHLKVKYDLDKIDTPSQINALRRLFPKEQINHLMRAFCTQVSTYCPGEQSECSRLRSLGESGQLCREWMVTLPSEAHRDSVKRGYCLENDTEDCQCINRAHHSDFNDLRKGMDAQTLLSTRCWYKPCEDNNNLLLDSEEKQGCVANVCQNIINAHAQGDIDITNNTSSISCNFSKEQLDEAELLRDKVAPSPPIEHPVEMWIMLNKDNLIILSLLITAVLVSGAIMKLK